MKKFLIALITLISLTGCGVLNQTEEVLAWTNQKFTLLDQRINELSEKQDQDVANLENVLGHSIDANGDGRVDVSEAKQALVELGTAAAGGNVEAKDKLFDPGTFLTLLLALAGIGGGKAVFGKLKNGKAVLPTGTSNAGASSVA